MASLSITPPFPIFSDRDGTPLEDGYIWIGTANQDARTNPIAVYWNSILTEPAAQPIRTLGGYPSRFGTPGQLFISAQVYSILVQDKRGTLVYSDQAAEGPSTFVNFSVSEEVQIATAGQTVFNLANTYSPGTNSLTVYIDGVNQYNLSSYVETNGNTVTFTNGLHVGAEVKFTTAIQLSGGATDASQVSYQPAGAGAVTTSVQAKLRESVSVKDFGAVGDGVTNDTAAIKAAIATGNDVFFPAGTYLVTDLGAVNNRQTLYSHNRSAKITYTNTSGTILEMSCFGSRIENLWFEGTGTGGSEIVIRYPTTGEVGYYPRHNIITGIRVSSAFTAYEDNGYDNYLQNFYFNDVGYGITLNSQANAEVSYGSIYGDGTGYLIDVGDQANANVEKVSTGGSATWVVNVSSIKATLITGCHFETQCQASVRIGDSSNCSVFIYGCTFGSTWTDQTIIATSSGGNGASIALVGNNFLNTNPLGHIDDQAGTRFFCSNNNGLSTSDFVTGNGTVFNADLFEKDTYTPILTTQTSGTLSTDRSLSYERVANSVTVVGQITITATSSPVGSYFTIDLPFTCENLVYNAGQAASTCIFYDNTAGTYTVLPVIVYEGTTLATVYIDVSTIGTSDLFTFNVSYLSE